MLSLLDITYYIETNIKEVAPNLFQVKIKSKEDVAYIVDMTIRRCECFSGRDGSICWHQCCLWSKGFNSLFHFLLKFDTFLGKKICQGGDWENFRKFFL